MKLLILLLLTSCAGTTQNQCLNTSSELVSTRFDECESIEDDARYEACMDIAVRDYHRNQEKCLNVAFFE